MRSIVLAGNPEDITTLMPEIAPTAPCPNDPASNPDDWAFVGLIGAKSGPTRPSMSGETPRMRRPWPRIAAYASAADDQIACEICADVGAAGSGVPPEAV